MPLSALSPDVHIFARPVSLSIVAAAVANPPPPRPHSSLLNDAARDAVPFHQSELRHRHRHLGTVRSEHSTECQCARLPAAGAMAEWKWDRHFDALEPSILLSQPPSSPFPFPVVVLIPRSRPVWRLWSRGPDPFVSRGLANRLATPACRDRMTVSNQQSNPPPRSPFRSRASESPVVASSQIPPPPPNARMSLSCTLLALGRKGRRVSGIRHHPYAIRLWPSPIPIPLSFALRTCSHIRSSFAELRHALGLRHQSAPTWLSAARGRRVEQPLSDCAITTRPGRSHLACFSRQRVFEKVRTESELNPTWRTTRSVRMCATPESRVKTRTSAES